MKTSEELITVNKNIRVELIKKYAPYLVLFIVFLIFAMN